MNFNYTHAIVCKSVPDSIKDGLSINEHEDVDVIKAREEHRLYLECLKNIGLKLIEIEGREEYPDCVFVEDCVIIIEKRAFITNPGAMSRRGEVQNIRKKLEEFALINPNEIIEVGSVKNLNESFIDGGDCCFTGRELLVGLSSRTNNNGADELENFFGNAIPVQKINVGSNALHLKSALTMVDVDTIVISRTAEGLFMRKSIELNSKFGSFYKFVEVDDNKAAN